MKKLKHLVEDDEATELEIFGVAKIIFDIPIAYLLVPGYIVAIFLTYLSNEEFVNILALLNVSGVRVPALLGYDLEQGFLLLEDLGGQSLLQRLVFVIYGSVHTEIAQDATLLLATRDGYHPASQDAPDLHNG